MLLFLKNSNILLKSVLESCVTSEQYHLKLHTLGLNTVTIIHKPCQQLTTKVIGLLSKLKSPYLRSVDIGFNKVFLNVLLIIYYEIREIRIFQTLTTVIISNFILIYYIRWFVYSIFITSIYLILLCTFLSKIELSPRNIYNKNMA